MCVYLLESTWCSASYGRRPSQRKQPGSTVKDAMMKISSLISAHHKKIMKLQLKTSDIYLVTNLY